MTDLEVRIGDEVATPDPDVTLTWLDAATGLARLVGSGTSHLVVVEGSGSAWQVSLRGRRVPVTVRSWRERVLAEAEVAASARGGPVEVAATLPGLVVAVAVAEGEAVTEGQSLLTIEAMKMQNEVRAPRAGRVVRLAVAPGTAVATGTLLLRLED